TVAPGQTFYDVGIHYIAGDGRVNENIGLTAIHDVFHKEHNRNVNNLITDHLMVFNPLTGTYTGPNGTGGTTTWTGEDLFQAAKLITEMEYQHMIFGEFARKLSPNINAFAAYDITLPADISAEFAHGVYRLGHSMLTETVDRGTYNALSGTATGVILQDQLLNDFLSPGKYITRAADGTNTVGEIAIGMTKQVGNEIDEWMTPTLRNNLVGQRLDLATLNMVRGRDSGLPSWNDTRASLYAQTGMSTLKPYGSWNEIGLNLLNPTITLKNLIMAYARDAILLRYGVYPTPLAAPATLNDWATLELADTATVQTFANALDAAATAAMADPVFMDLPVDGGNTDFWSIDLWMGGLAEKKVPGGMLGSTFDAVFASQQLALQNGDRFYYLSRLAGTNILVQIESQRVSDIIMRNTGVTHLYSDAVSVADASIELATALNHASLLALSTGGGVSGTTPLGTAGFVAGVFYGNPGNYLSASGLLSPNGVGNASETIGGTDGANTINALGGNDTVWADGANDTVDGGDGNDFLHGGDGNDVISDLGGDDLIWGDAGDDNINAGSGLDQVFAGLGNDRAAGGLGADVVDGGTGADLLYGDNGTVDPVTGNVDPSGGDDVVDGGDGNDTIYGGGGNDALTGDAGDDVIDGGTGNNLLSGLDGNDLFLNDPGQLGFNSSFDGGIGFDTVDYSRSSGNLTPAGTRIGVNIDLSNGAVAVIPVGGNVADAFLSVEALLGSAFDDILSGGLRQPGLGGANRPTAVQTDAAGNPILNAAGVAIPMDFSVAGQGGNDWVLGSDGNDTLSGGAGSDTLMGGLANDRFLFTTEVVAGAVDVIVDFQTVAGNTDLIVLDRTGFTGLNGGTALTLGEFLVGGAVTGAATATQRIIYNTNTGALYYDSDGVGGLAAIQFASL
ncbi:MAG: peroxidase family protein, partial [Prochlorococcaceae cyanobacterium]